LDPFAGSGTVGRAAIATGRRFFLIDRETKYFEAMRDELVPLAKEHNVQVRFLPSERRSDDG
jgi:DNA modification methylase